MPTIEFRIVLLKGGDLENAFAECGPTLVLRKDRSPTKVIRVWNRLKIPIAMPPRTVKWRPLPEEQECLNNFLSDFRPDLIYINSVAAAPIFGYLRPMVPVITYVRELEKFVRYTVATGWFSDLADRTSLFISVSQASKNYLAVNHRVSPNRFTVIPPFIDIARLAQYSRSEARRQLCNFAGRSQCSFIIAACGTTDWRKGPDRFVAVAEEFFSREPESDTVFIWIGGMDDPRERSKINRAIDRAKLNGRVCFPGAKPNSASILGGADVFAMTSREEPFGRVMLEAGITSVPTVCFRQCGGAEEFVEKGAGIAVEPDDITGFSEAIQRLLTDDVLRIQLGKRAREIVLNDHDPQISSQLIMSKIREVVSVYTDKQKSDPIKYVQPFRLRARHAFLQQRQ